MSDDFRKQVVDALIQAIAAYNEKMYYEDEDFRAVMLRDNEDAIELFRKNMPDDMPDKDSRIEKMKTEVTKAMENPDQLRDGFVQMAKMEFYPEMIQDNINQMFRFIPSFLIPQPIRVLIEKFNTFFKELSAIQKLQQKPILDILVKLAEEHGLTAITMDAFYDAIRQVYPTAEAFRTSVNSQATEYEQRVMDFEKEMCESDVGDDEMAKTMLKQLSSSLYDTVYSKKNTREYRIAKKIKQLYGEGS